MSKFTFTERSTDAPAAASGQLTLFAKDNFLKTVDDTGFVRKIIGAETTDDIDYPLAIGDAVPTPLTTILRALQSAGLTSGGVITVGVGESVDVTSGFGGLRQTNDDSDDLFSIAWAAASTLSVPTDTDIFVGVRFNSGSPEVFTKTTNSWNYNDEFPLGTAINVAGIVEVLNDPHDMSNLPGLVLQRLYETDPFAIDVRTGGFRLADSADNLKHILMTSGALWDRLNRLVFPAIDTGSGDDFRRYFKDGAGGFTQQLSQTTWDNVQRDDGSGTLVNITTSFYVVQWIWLDITNGELLLLYGTDEYATLSEAENENLPSPRPEIIDDTGRLLGRFIVQQGVNIASLVQGVSDFTPELADLQNHSLLTNLDVDDHTQYSLVDGTRDFTGTIGGLDPVASTDFTTKNYVDNQNAIEDWQKSCLTATTANIVLTGFQTIDGTLLVDGDRVLVKDQTSPAQNGIYEARTGTWNRAPDANTAGKLNSHTVAVSDGTVGENKAYYQTDTVVTIETDSVSYIFTSRMGDAFSSSTGVAPTNQIPFGQGTTELNFNSGFLFDGTELTIPGQLITPNNVAIGPVVITTQGACAIAIGDRAGRTNQGATAVAIGNVAGDTSQGIDAIAIGNISGTTSQGTLAVCIGSLAGTTNQGPGSIAIGRLAGNGSQATLCVAIGQETGETNQATGAIALGNRAGRTSQGISSIALGQRAGITSQAANGIIISSTGINENNTTPGHIVLKSSLASLIYDGIQWDFLGGDLNVADDLNVTGDINGIGNNSVVSTTPDSTVSATMAVIAGMTNTPAAGKYSISFSASGSNSVNSAVMNYELAIAGIPIADTFRTNHGGTGGNQFPDVTFSMHTQAIVDLNGAEAIEARFSTSAGTYTVDERSLILIRLDN